MKSLPRQALVYLYAQAARAVIWRNWGPWSSTKIERAASALWARPEIDAALWASAFIVWELLYKYPQPPGTAAIMLAAWATAMTFREMKPTRKIAGTFMIALFATLEFRSIHQDHVAQNAAHQADQRELQARFAAVLKQNQNAFNATEHRIETLIDNSENIFNNVSGGSSFVYVVPNSRVLEPCIKSTKQSECKTGVALMAVNGGDYPMRGISIDVTLNNYLAPQPNNATKLLPTMRIPEIPPHGSEMLPGIIYPQLQTPGNLQYVIEITAENGSVKETIDFRAELTGVPYLDKMDPRGFMSIHFRASRMEAVKGQPNTSTERILVDSDLP